MRAPKVTPQREHQASAVPGRSPAAVSSQLRTPGRPLDPSTRTTMEQRFGHDFGRIRVHSGLVATASARSLEADAYTIGNDIVFADGRYRPRTAEGSALLAHELAHTIQQQAATSGSQKLAMAAEHAAVAGSPAAEQEAQAAATAVRQGRSPSVSLRRPVGLARQPAKPSPPEIDKSNQLLTDDDLNAVNESRNWSNPYASGVKFVIHDAALTKPFNESKVIDNQAKEDRGSLGRGAAAWVPKVGAAKMTRQQLFETQRPTTTGWEKVLDQYSVKGREEALRQVWGLSLPSERSIGLQEATADLTAEEAALEEKKAERQLNSRTETVETAAHWAVQEMCYRLRTGLATPMVFDPMAATILMANCAYLDQYFTEREARLGSAMNVEMVQPAGSQCSTSGKLQRLPPYTASQYSNVAALYVAAAVEAGRFPEIFSHFSLDTTTGTHCDPRCFDLGRLYETIRVLFKHPAGTRYGARPSYGLKRGTHAIWWQDTVCGGTAPVGSK